MGRSEVARVSFTALTRALVMVVCGWATVCGAGPMRVACRQTHGACMKSCNQLAAPVDGSRNMARQTCLRSCGSQLAECLAEADEREPLPHETSPLEEPRPPPSCAGACWEALPPEERRQSSHTYQLCVDRCRVEDPKARAEQERERKRLEAEHLAAIPYPTELQVGAGVPFGFGYTLSGVSTSSALAHDFFFAFRPSLTLTPKGLRNFGVGIYSEFGTLRTFRDFHFAGGVQLRGPGKSRVLPVLSVGGCLNTNSLTSAGGVEVGFYLGQHMRAFLTETLGLKMTARHYFGPVTSWTATVSLELDVILIWSLGRPRSWPLE
jgi:hypothetical protein